MSDNIATQESKKALRAKLKKTRDEFAASPSFQKSQDLLCKNILKFMNQKKVASDRQSVWAGYRALPTEADPALAMSRSDAGAHVSWALPRVEDRELKFFIPDSLDSLIPGRFGILEPNPASSSEVSLDEIDGVLIPGLAFDVSGGRVGYGGGFYDRALSEFEGLKVGVAFEFQIQSALLPREQHDVSVDVIVTDHHIHEIVERKVIYG